MPKAVLGGRDRSVGTHMPYRLVVGAVCLSWALFLQFLPLKIPAFGVFTLKIITTGTRRKTSATSQLNHSNLLSPPLCCPRIYWSLGWVGRGGRRTSAWEHTAMTSWLGLPSLPQVTLTAVQGVAASCLLGAGVHKWASGPVRPSPSCGRKKFRSRGSLAPCDRDILPTFCVPNCVKNQRENSRCRRRAGIYAHGREDGLERGVRVWLELDRTRQASILSLGSKRGLQGQLQPQPWA